MTGEVQGRLSTGVKLSRLAPDHNHGLVDHDDHDEEDEYNFHSDNDDDEDDEKNLLIFARTGQ